MQDDDTTGHASNDQPPEARLQAALAELGRAVAALPDPDSPEMKDAEVLRAEADSLRAELAELRETLAEAESMVHGLSRADQDSDAGDVISPFASTARLAQAAAESLAESEKEATALREALKMLDHSYQLLKQSHEDAVAELAKAQPDPTAELAAMRAARAAEAAELDILRGRLAALISSPEGEPSDE